MYDIKEPQQRAILVFPDKPKHTDLAAALSVSLLPAEKNDEQELTRLVEGLHIHAAAVLRFRVRDTHKKYILGRGQLETILEAAQQRNAQYIICNISLAPRVHRNLEDFFNMPVLDREAVIIELFAARAKTREARLQTELARLEYMLPRLAGMRSDFARQRGGVKGSKGSGETRLELDRRRIRKRILVLKKEVKAVRAHRAVQRKNRRRNSVKTAALVGYTNSGKSSLLKALTGTDAYVEDKLFATLDAKTSRVFLPPDIQLLVTDTVGFISSLPHRLIDAFYATLEEAVLADFLIIVCDGAAPNFIDGFNVTKNVLTELDCQKKPALVVLNKKDAIHDQDAADRFLAETPDTLVVSVKTGEGLAALRSTLSNMVSHSEVSLKGAGLAGH